MNVFDQFAFNVSPGPHYAAADALPPVPPTGSPVRYIAFYLPQFHAIAENNAWWGEGFTEWTNVTKAIPRYAGHLQPRLPQDLGFYDLNDAEVLRKQAGLARRAGIEGFCIHDYWFAGRKLLGTPLRLLLDNPDIDLPFCLNWANENWSRRWDGLEQELLLEQVYDVDDLTGYVRSILPALADRRYMRIAGRPIVMVYRPECIPEPARMFDAWREFLVREGFGNPYLVKAQNFSSPSGDAKFFDPRPYGMDAAAGFPPHMPDMAARNDVQFRDLLDLSYQGHVVPYTLLARQMLATFSTDFVTFPGVCPGWDNEARKPGRGVSFPGATPERYASWLLAASRQVLENNAPDERLVFVNAWNEWAEGAILEPDRHFGHAFLVQTRAVADRLIADPSAAAAELDPVDERPHARRTRNRVRRQVGRALRPLLG